MRKAGILLHITSLPSACVGDLGPEAYKFVDFMEDSGQKIWQVLPLNPTCPEHGNSPYYSTSLFAGNPLLISLDLLYQDGLIQKKVLEVTETFPQERVNHGRVWDFKKRIFDVAFENFKEDQEYYTFVRDNLYWLESYAKFKVLRDRFRKPWNEWEDENTKGLEKEIRKEYFLQFIFFKQWKGLKDYANKKGVKLMGDLPIYPAYDSADVWENREIFKLGKDNRPFVVAGVPPDYFSKTGQLWGNPVYDWERLKEENFDWWIKRIKHNLNLFDMLRLDHFRGFVAYYEVPAFERTAERGRWIQAPAEEFFKRLKEEFPQFPFVAEDLGLITPDVESMRDRFGFPGMKVLVFAFDSENSPFMPHNHRENFVVYTTTHDNMPVRDWYKDELDEVSRKRLHRYTGRILREDEVSDVLIRLAYMSVAKYCIIPMQDLLNLGKESRMNTPGKKEGNWEWKMKEIPRSLSDRLRELCITYGR